MKPNRLNLSEAQLAPLIVGCALFMEMLDATIISTALPVIAHSMHEDPIRLNLAITSYLLSLAVFIPISGWVADRFGARTVFRTAIIIFTIGSILCGISHSLQQLVAARIAQGFGGAMMMPVGRLIVLQDGAQIGVGHRDVIPDGARDSRSGGGPAAGRLHRDLLLVALDFFHQCADRDHRLHAGHDVHRERARGPMSFRSTFAAS